MKEVQYKIGNSNVEFTSDTSNNVDPYIIGVFANEHCGKTRLALTGPSGVGCVITEMKSYVTLDKDSVELGKKIFKPKDPLSLIVNGRHVSGLKDDVERQRFYAAHVKKVEDTVFGLLEHKEVNLVMLDKFTHYCAWVEFAINGMSEKFIKVQGKLYQDKKEVIQHIIDFLNSLSQYGKPVLLLCAAKDDYEVLDSEKKPVRKTWDCGSFKFLGSHANITVELVDNKRWEAGSTDERKAWHWRMNVRRCQKNPGLEGLEGNPLLEDDMISLGNLISTVDPGVDVERWM